MTPSKYAKMVEDESRFRRAMRDPGFLGWNFLPEWVKLTVWLELAVVSGFYTAKGFGWIP